LRKKELITFIMGRQHDGLIDIGPCPEGKLPKF
jgi:hypothetical protein